MPPRNKDSINKKNKNLPSFFTHLPLHKKHPRDRLLFFFEHKCFPALLLLLLESSSSSSSCSIFIKLLKESKFEELLLHVEHYGRQQLSQILHFEKELCENLLMKKNCNNTSSEDDDSNNSFPPSYKFTPQQVLETQLRGSDMRRIKSVLIDGNNNNNNNSSSSFWPILFRRSINERFCDPIITTQFYCEGLAKFLLVCCNNNNHNNNIIKEILVKVCGMSSSLLSLMINHNDKTSQEEEKDNDDDKLLIAASTKQEEQNNIITGNGNTSTRIITTRAKFSSCTKSTSSSLKVQYQFFEDCPFDFSSSQQQQQQQQQDENMLNDDEDDDANWIDEDETSSDDDDESSSDDEEIDDDEDEDVKKKSTTTKRGRKVLTTKKSSSSNHQKGLNNLFLPLFDENKKTISSYDKENQVQVIEYEKEKIPTGTLIEFIINFVFPSKVFGAELDPLRDWSNL